MEAGVIEDAGHYRQEYVNSGLPSGYRVRLFRLTAAVLPDKKQHPHGNRRRVKARQQRRCWQHPLFGDITGLPPPGISRRAVRRMRSLDELGLGFG
jgi:hypothetical protein